MSDFDVDIDVPPNTDRGKYGIRAMQYIEEKADVKAHPSGFYIDGEVAVDVVTGLAAVDYKQAEEEGLVKVDLLTNTAYSLFQSKEDLLQALDTEPNWEDLHNPEIVEKLPHVANHGDLLDKIEPRSVQELADVLAMIRPAKRKFVNDYRANTAYVREQLYKKPDEGMYFKKSHAISYAQMVVAVMNRLDARRFIQF